LGWIQLATGRLAMILQVRGVLLREAQKAKLSSVTDSRGLLTADT
jgi:hypothetical protein